MSEDLKCKLGNFSTSKKSAIEVSIALLIACVNRGSFDSGFETRGRQFSFIQKQGSRNLGELAFHIGDHHVLDLELRDGVSRVDLTGGD